MSLFGFKKNKCLDEVYSTEEIDAKLANKSDASHNHDERYYTETEVNNLLANKSNSGHNHNDMYYTETEVNNLLSKKMNLGTTLYSNATGTIEAITLPETSANFNKFEITYRYNNIYATTVINNPNGKEVSLNLGFSINETIARHQFKTVVINGTSIKTGSAGYIAVSNNGTSDASSRENAIYITKIVGYK